MDDIAKSWKELESLMIKYYERKMKLVPAWIDNEDDPQWDKEVNHGHNLMYLLDLFDPDFQAKLQEKENILRQVVKKKLDKEANLHPDYAIR